MNQAIASGIIDITQLQEQIEMSKRKDILNNHPYSVWQASNGKWCTYVPQPGANKDRIIRRRKTKKEIENLIVEFWENYEEEQSLTFNDVYFKWREVQDQLVSNNSVAVYNSDYKRFFENTDFVKLNILDITENKIKIFMKNKIEELVLRKEASKKLYLYISRTIFFARKEKIITDNPVEFLKASDFYKYCTERVKKTTDNIISDDDMDKLMKRFKEDHTLKPNYIPTYAVELAMLTGMRVGELAALRWDSINGEYIIIDKSEIHDQINDVRYISKTKNGKIRFFPLTNKIKELLKTIEKVEKEYGYYCEWVFADEFGRIDAGKISYCSKNKCRQLGIDQKGIHAFRKTLNSKLRCSGVSSTVAASLLGHSPEVNEKYYTFDVTSIDDKRILLEKI